MKTMAWLTEKLDDQFPYSKTHSKNCPVDAYLDKLCDHLAINQLIEPHEVPIKPDWIASFHETLTYSGGVTEYAIANYVCGLFDIHFVR